MSGRINGGRARMLDLEAARRSSQRLKRSSLSPDEARFLIDSVFLRYGMDPTLWTDFSGWRHIMIGSAEGFAGVVEWQKDEHYLVVLAPILDIPEKTEQLLEFYRMLLELNYHGTLSAHFSIYEDTLYLGITRPIWGLDEEEVDEAIRTVMVLADTYDDRLQELIQLIPPSLPELPDIKMRPKDAKIMGLTLSACDGHGQRIFRYLIKQWDEQGYIVEAGTTGVALCFLLDDQPYALAALHPGFADRRQEVILSWGGLRRRAEFHEENIRQFQTDVFAISEVKTMANTGHLEVTEDFNMEAAVALIEAMVRFAKNVSHELVGMVHDLEDMNLTTFEDTIKPSTLQRISRTLHNCDPQAQRIFLKLLQGWHAVGGSLECKSPGRIYLILETGEHAYGSYGVLSHRINLGVLVAPLPDQVSRIELAWNLASGQFAYLDFAPQEVEQYESIVSKLPGFTDQGLQKSVLLSGSFKDVHAAYLLQAWLDLRLAVEVKNNSGKV